MSNSITSTSSNALRITGMATGLDTDTLIKQMMAAENMKVDKLKQNQQYTVWRQEAFRDIIKDFRDLRNSYLLIDSPSDTNMIKSGAYSGAKITPSAGNTDALTATALPGAVNGVSTVTVTKIAKAAKIDGDKIATNVTDAVNVSNWVGKTIKFTVNGSSTPVDVTVGSTVGNGSDLVNQLNDAINQKDGLKGKVRASLTLDNKVMFSVLTSDTIKITEDTTIADLGVLKGRELNPTVSTKLSDIDPNFKSTDTKSFYIKQGGKISSKITIKGDYTIQQVIDEISKANAKNGETSTSLNSDLKVSFSDLTKKLTIETRNTGSAQSLQIAANEDGTGSIDLSNILGIKTLTTDAKGQDAEVSIKPPGVAEATTITRASNNFTVDNVTYSLIKDPEIDGIGDPKHYDITLTTQANAEESVKKIKAFVDKYNTLVKKINDKLTEKKDYNYKPLTADEKKEMEEDDIKAWEEKAKKGLLKNDGDLQQILFSMRNAFMSGIDSAGIKVSEIGIDTYGGLEAVSKPGQLKIDEAKLKKALEERGDQVMKIFTASEPSDSALPSTMPSKYTDASKWQEQYKYDNTGIFRRIESIINNSAGKFDSILLKKAGYEGTVSEFTNTITKQIQDQDKAISELSRKLYDKQERYYQMFARLESAMNQMNSQQSWLTQQLGQ